MVCFASDRSCLRCAACRCAAWQRLLVLVVLVVCAVAPGVGAATAAVPQPAPRNPPASPVCRGLDGTAVDWWLALKLPHGTRYLYTDAQRLGSCVGQQCWVQGASINDAASPLRATLGELLVQQGLAAGHVLYNDEDDAGVEHFAFAHSKGVLGVGPEGGFWLQHSLPHYPQVPAADAAFSLVAHPQQLYGQHAFCTSLRAADLDLVGGALLAVEPFVYSGWVPADLAAVYPAVQALVRRRFNTSSTDLHIGSLATRQGVSLLLLAKAGRYRIAMHEQGVEAALGSAMQWETWRHGPSAMNATCPPQAAYASVNVERLTFRDSTWSSMADHSKWGISVPSAAAHVCLGDLNRERSQMRRGGAFVCTRSGALWGAFRALIADVDVCAADGLRAADA